MLNRTPDFENRLLKTLFCQGEPDAVPLMEAGIIQPYKERFLGYPIQSLEDEITFWATAGFDYIPLEAGLRTIIDAAIHHEGTGRYEKTPHENPKVSDAKNFAIEKLMSQSLQSTTEAGTQRTWAPGAVGFFTSIADLEAFPWPEPEDLSYEIFYQTRKALPKGMGILAFSGAIFSCLTLSMGMEACLIGMLQGDELFERLLKKVGEFQVQVVEKLVREGLVDGIWINDDMGFRTRTLVNPNLYHKYTFPYYREIKKILTSKNIPLLLHSDGNITSILKDLVEIGFNAIHPIEPEAMDILQARELVGQHTCLIGNVGLNYPLGNGTPKEVERETRKLIQAMAPGGGYCISSANSIPEYVPYENWQAMHQAALKYGLYPIR